MKTIFGLKTETLLAAGFPVLFTLAQPSFVMAQAPATISVHGHVTDPGGNPVRTGEVRLTTDKTSAEKDRKYQFTFPLDGNGDFKGTDITPGDYLAIVVVNGKTPDFQPFVVKAGEDRTLNFDMTRAEYLKALSPEERAAIEENKKKNAGVKAENVKIANINQALGEARANIKAGKSDDAIKAMQDLIQQKPDESILYATLGEAQLASANVDAKAARAAKTSPSDPAILQKYSDAAASYQKAIELNAASKKPNPETASISYLNIGEAYGKSGKTKEASEAYENAVKANPPAAASAYYNEAATFYNAQKLDEALAAADKAIAADPKRADAYYIKAQALIPKATVDAKTQKIVAPPGCIEAYQDYLEIAPTGIHAAEIKELLTNLGQPIKNSFKKK